MKMVIIILAFAFSGCVSVKEARRYGEVRYWEGVLYGAVELSRLWRPVVDRQRRKINELERLAEKAAIKTDGKFEINPLFQPEQEVCFERLKKFMGIEEAKRD
jgi:hypothetical protein